MYSSELRSLEELLLCPSLRVSSWVHHCMPNPSICRRSNRYLYYVLSNRNIDSAWIIAKLSQRHQSFMCLLSPTSDYQHTHGSLFLNSNLTIATVTTEIARSTYVGEITGSLGAINAYSVQAGNRVLLVLQSFFFCIGGDVNDGSIKTNQGSGPQRTKNSLKFSFPQ
ncbi:hypothetical protein PG990_014430 [Apiospora arundinis]